MFSLHRPVEEIVFADLALDDESERRRAAIRKARKMTSDLAGLYFLAHAQGVPQAALAEMAGVEQQTVSYHICNFKKYLRIAYQGAR